MSGPKQVYLCVGCDGVIPWDGKSPSPCGCGATIFYEENTNAVALPASLIRNLICNHSYPHLDCLVGRSIHVSDLKFEFIDVLRTLGFTWKRECPRCQEDSREHHLAIQEAERIFREGSNQ